MQLVTAFLADAAQVTPDGKFQVIGGGWDRLNAQQFPTTHPLMTLFAKISGQAAECGRSHQLALELWDSDGNLVMPRLEGTFTIERRKDSPFRPSNMQITFNLVNVVFTAPGDYAFQLTVDGQLIGHVPLEVVAA